jgi:hypothetical protein
MTPRIDHSKEKGRKFGFLTFDGEYKKGKYRNTLWKSTCVCGNIVWAPWYEYKGSLKKKGKRSCGCAKRGLTPEEAAKSYCIKTYQENAKSRGLPFELTLNQFIKLAEANCFYCNSRPTNIAKSKYGIFLYNGIDRVNNSLGYTIDNCVTSCKVCNKIKAKLSKAEFYELVENIIKRISKIKEKLYD